MEECNLYIRIWDGNTMTDKNVTKRFPPMKIYKECKQRFGISFEKDTIFAYEPNIHAYKGCVSEHTHVHELTHLKQQRDIGGPEIWWEKYLDDDEFRLEQEIEAYRNQLAFAVGYYNSKFYKRLLDHVLNDLSGNMYGNLISYDDAKDLLLN